MGANYKEVGGGPATGLAQNLIKALQSGITGSFGSGTSAAQAGAANPIGSTTGIMGLLDSLFSQGAGNIGGSLSSMITKQGDRDVNALRARFGAGGGSSFGTPGAYAEALLRSETAPKLTTAIGGLQLNALSQILPVMAGLAGKGISQRETVAEQNPWLSGLSIAGQLGSTIAGIATGNPLAALSTMSTPQLPALTPSFQNTTFTPQQSTTYMNPQYIRNVAPLFSMGG